MGLQGYLRSTPGGLTVAALSTCLLVALLAPFRSSVGLLNAGFIFLLVTLLTSAVWGSWVGLFAAVLNNLAFNFFFINPLHTFNVQEPRNAIALVIFLAVSIVGGTLLSSARRSAREAKRRQAEAETVLHLTHDLSLQTEPGAALEALCREVTKAFAARGTAVLVKEEGLWRVLAGDGSEDAFRDPDSTERQLLDEAARKGVFVGRGGLGLSSKRKRRIVAPRGREDAYLGRGALAMVPLRLGGDVRGVLRLDGPIGDSPFRHEPEALLNAIAAEAAIAIQRLQLAHDAAQAEALRQADEMKSALMTSISHDLKTPLAGIKASVSSLLDSHIVWSEKDVSAFYHAIDSQADSLNRIIGGILDLNRIESGALVPEEASIPASLILEVANQLTQAQTRGRKVVIDAPEGLFVIADEALVTQAVVNLIENAAKYSPEGSTIELQASSRGEHVKIEVKDEGSGIDKEDIPHIFERYYRSSGSSRRAKGSGLGLTIVKGFIELCRGSVEVESSSRGTTFTILLPAGSGLPVGQ